MLFLSHVSTLSAPFLFITADICKTSKISVICKLASHISPFKTLIGWAVFTNPNAPPWVTLSKHSSFAWARRAHLGFGIQAGKSQRFREGSFGNHRSQSGQRVPGQQVLLPSCWVETQRNYAFLVAKRSGSSTPGQNSQGIEITFLRKVRSWFSRKNIYRQHLWRESSDGGDTGCFWPGFLPSFSGYGTLASSEAPSGWLIPDSWL